MDRYYFREYVEVLFVWQVLTSLERSNIMAKEMFVIQSKDGCFVSKHRFKKDAEEKVKILGAKNCLITTAPSTFKEVFYVIRFNNGLEEIAFPRKLDAEKFIKKCKIVDFTLTVETEEEYQNLLKEDPNQ